jgi:hypothetical protein
LKIFWEEEFKGQVQCEVFHLSFSLSWMTRDFARIVIVFAVEIIFEEGQSFLSNKRMLGLR